MKALLDCNNFFASCERVFDPALRERPVAVLSSNDGCIIARSNEVKALGVPMGAPYFQYKNLLARHGVVLKSSNFALYTDMSRRVMATICLYAPKVEVYSVDEAFVELHENEDFQAWAEMIKDRVHQDTGIPMSIGVAPTRTLAKAGATLAKQGNGIMSFAHQDDSVVDEYLGRLAAEQVWGIGRNLSAQLRAYGIRSALDVKCMPDKLMERFSVTFRRSVGELRGVVAETSNDPHSKSMASTRSFGTAVSGEHQLREAVSMHAMKLAAKLRREAMRTQLLAVFISTGKSGEFLHARMPLPLATNSSQEMVQAACELLGRAYRQGLSYKRAGVVAYSLTPVQQLAFGGDLDQMKLQERIDGVIDEVNERWGPHALSLGSEGVDRSWEPKHLMRSPRYTTEWHELKTVA